MFLKLLARRVLFPLVSREVPAVVEEVMRAHLSYPKVLSENGQCGKCAGMFSRGSG